MMVARFVSSMMMHFIVEPDIRRGLEMMKYVLNHRHNFTDVYPPYFVGLVDFINQMAVELLVMLIFVTTENILGVMLKFVSLSAINRIP